MFKQVCLFHTLHINYNVDIVYTLTNLPIMWLVHSACMMESLVFLKQGNAFYWKIKTTAKGFFLKSNLFLTINGL